MVEWLAGLQVSPAQYPIPRLQGCPTAPQHPLKPVGDPFYSPFVPMTAAVTLRLQWTLNRRWGDGVRGLPQETNGSFRDSGNVIHTEMQGGTGSGTSLTAYVLTALVRP